MRRILFPLVFVAMLVPCALSSETMRLKDGSTIQGRLVRVDGDTLHFETSFGSLLRIHKDNVARIDFVEGAGSAAGRSESPMQTSEAPGTLQVRFDQFELTSRIRVERDREREAHEKENAIEMALWIEGKKVYSFADSTTDKVVREGPVTTLRNDMKPADFKVALEPGFHQCSLTMGNARASAYKDRFDPAPLDKRLALDNVNIVPARTTVVRVGLKRKAWRVGKTELVKLE